MRLIFILRDAHSFHGLPVEASPGAAQLSEPEAGAWDENVWRSAFVEKCVTEKPGRPLVTMKFKWRNERNAG
jgi:hypothetical protein